jgi:tellurite resistance protein TerC
MDWSIIVIILQLIFLEGILSIDNAAVLGALVARLPDDEHIPWPRSLEFIGDHLHHLLGKQRDAALRVGLLGAYLGRTVMLFLASFIIQNPWLKLVGAAYLIRLAMDNLGALRKDYGGEGAMRPVKEKTFWGMVLTVELMDLAFSLDNVVAAVSLSDKLWVVLLGVAVGILALRFAAGIFSRLVEREPILQQAAYVLVLNIGVELLLEDLAHLDISDWVKFGISASTILLSLAYAHWRFMRVFRPLLVWLSQGFAIAIDAVEWALAPFKGLLSLVIQGLRLIFRRPVETN